jgi:hypothetical protein
MEKQIANLKKQNEGIQFTKLSIDSVDLEKEILFLHL